MFVRVPIEMVQPNPFQTRSEMGDVDELARSILDLAQARPDTSGLLQVPPARLWGVAAGRSLPGDGLVPTEVVELLEAGRAAVELAAGHRRLAAFWQLAGALGDQGGEYATFPVSLQVLSDEQMADVAWAENAEREDVNAIDEALAIRAAMDRFGWSQTEIAQRWRLSRPGVANKLRLLKLPDEAQAAIRQGVIGERHGRVLLSAMAKSPTVLEQIAQELLPAAPPPAEALEKAKELAPRFKRQYYGMRRDRGPFECVSCGGEVRPANSQMYVWHNFETGQTEKMCERCYRAAVGWSPPSVAEAEAALADVADQLRVGLGAAPFPLDEAIGEGQDGINAACCDGCPYVDEVICLDAHCYNRKAQLYDECLVAELRERVAQEFDVVAELCEGWGGVDLSSLDEIDVALLAEGICTPAACPRLRYKRVHGRFGGDIRPYDDLPFILNCNHSSSHMACRERYVKAKKSDDERGAERLAKRLARQNKKAARDLRQRAVRAVRAAIAAGEPLTWFLMARRLYGTGKVKKGADLEAYAMAIAEGLLGDPAAYLQDWSAPDAVDNAEGLLCNRLKELGARLPDGAAELGERLDRIEGFVRDEAGVVRGDLTPEQLAGNLDNLDQLGVDLSCALSGEVLDQTGYDDLDGRRQALAVALDVTRGLTDVSGKHDAGDDPPPVELGPEVDRNQYGMITTTSVEYAQSYIKAANLATLRACLETEKTGRQRKTLLARLESAIRKREKDQTEPLAVPE